MFYGEYVLNNEAVGLRAELVPVNGAKFKNITSYAFKNEMLQGSA